MKDNRPKNGIVLIKYICINDKPIFNFSVSFFLTIIRMLLVYDVSSEKNHF